MTKVPPLVWGAILIAASLAFPTWKFGLRFLRQFFISPFQFFILPLWLISYFSVRTGSCPREAAHPFAATKTPRPSGSAFGPASSLEPRCSYSIFASRGQRRCAGRKIGSSNQQCIHEFRPHAVRLWNRIVGFFGAASVILRFKMMPRLKWYGRFIGHQRPPRFELVLRR